MAPVLISPRSQPLKLNDSAGIGFAGDHWHGSFRVSSRARALCVDVVGIEKYLRGVVPSEMPASWSSRRSRPRPSRPAPMGLRPATRRGSSTPTPTRAARSTGRSSMRRRRRPPPSPPPPTGSSGTSGALRPRSSRRAQAGARPPSRRPGERLGEPYLKPVVDRYDSADGANPNHTWASHDLHPAASPRRSGSPASSASTMRSTRLPAGARRWRSLVGRHSTFTGDQVQGDLGLRSNYFRLLQRTLVTPTTAVAGAGFTITGRDGLRRPADSRSNAGVGAGTPWQVVVASLHVGGSGNFAVRLTPEANRYYRLVSAGAAISPAVLVKVQPALTLGRRGGTSGPACTRRCPVRSLQLYQHTAAGWGRSSRDAAGTATRPSRRPCDRHVARPLRGDATHLRGHSAAITVP